MAKQDAEQFSLSLFSVFLSQKLYIYCHWINQAQNRRDYGDVAAS